MAHGRFLSKSHLAKFFLRDPRWNLPFGVRNTKVQHPALPAHPLFYEDITLHELAGEIKKLNSNRFPGPGDDAITNRMI